jgi:hypothetical protein
MSFTQNSVSLIKATLAITVIGVSLVATAGGANAYGKKTLDANAALEETAIEQGRYNGNLTRREYRDLKAEQETIKALERRALADGHLSKREYYNIREAQANAKHHIIEETNDNQKSWFRRWLYNHRY